MRWRPVMTGGQLLLAASAGVVLAGGSLSVAYWPRIAGGPVTVARPAHVTAVALGQRCVVRGAPHAGGGHGRVRLSPGPTSATVIWLPGLNDPCRIATTFLDAADAERFVVAVNAGRAFPSGPMSCPSDDGSRALVYVSHARTTTMQLVSVHLAGCGGLSAPGRTLNDRTSEPLALGIDPLHVRPR